MKKFIEIIKKLYTKNKVVFFISSFVVLVALGLLVWYFWIQPSFFKQLTFEQQVKLLDSKVENVRTLDDYNKFAKSVEETIEKNPAISSAQRFELYILSSTTAINLSFYEQAYQNALKAENTIPSSVSANLIGNALMLLGKKNEAIEYYKKALSRFVINDEMDSVDAGYIEAKIIDAGGSI